jgi:hypothetical protein
MAGGPLLPSSIYLGGASGNLSSTFYSPGGAATTITNQGSFEGIGVVGSLASQSNAILQFNMPETIPTGVLKLRLLAMTNSTTGTAFWTTYDGATSVASSIQATTLTAEAAQSINFATLGVQDVLNENKQALATSPTSNQILTVVIAFATTTFTVTNTTVWQASIVWE